MLFWEERTVWATGAGEPDPKSERAGTHLVLAAKHQTSPSEFLSPTGISTLSRRVGCRNFKQSIGVPLRIVPFPIQGT